MKIFIACAILFLSSGCATLRERERQDPGHGAFTGILQYISLAAQAPVCWATHRDVVERIAIDEITRDRR